MNTPAHMDEHTLDAAVVAAAEAAAAAVAAEEVEDDQVFTIEMMDVGGQGLRVGRTTGNGLHPPLLMFNGIGGNIELLAPLAHALAEREVITFDIPGVGRSQMPRLPYRLRDIANLATRLLDMLGHRQVDVLESGGKIVQETRLFDPDTGSTRSMRSKEDAHDYRYFPDPDLLPLELDDAFLEECRASLPELPDAKRHREENALGLSPSHAGVLTADADTARWFEAQSISHMQGATCTTGGSRKG